MSDQANELDRVGQLDQSVEQLTSEVTSLKLELATLSSAIRELQRQHVGSRLSAPANALASNLQGRPSMTPAAIVVLIAAGLLSWQVIATPQADRQSANRQDASTPRVVPPSAGSPITIEAATEPPVTPLVRPTIYKGTLTVKADRPGARVFVNRKDVGTAPVRVANLRAGAHLVWVESEGYRRWTRVVTVPAETVTRVSVDLEPDPVIEQ